MAGRDSLYDIPDSTDWLNTPLALFSQVESSLRCQVCKDFFKTPMITSCAHTFCSLCIRHCYSSDKKCPTCRAAGQETQLRRNGAMEEAVEAFQNARTAALDFARQSHSNIRSASPKRKLDVVVEEEEVSADRPSKRTRSSSRRTLESAVRAEPAEKSRETISLIDDDNGDGEYRPVSDLVDCPVCLHKVKAATINSHLDTDCPPKPRMQPSSTLRLDVSRSSRQSINPSSRPTRLPFLSYNGMKENILKKKLTELGIPSFGTKIEMQNRHTEWISIWNANCDAKYPKSTKDLRADLDIWERTQGALAPKSSGGIGSAIKDENFDGSGWAATHHNEYNDLIAIARQKRGAPMSTPKSDSSTPIQSSEPVAPSTDNFGNHETTYPSPYGHVQQVNAPGTQKDGSINMTEASSNKGQGVPDERPAEFQTTAPIIRTGIEPPFTSSQVLHPRASDEPTSSQFTASPGSKILFEGVDAVVDTNLDITPHR